MTKKELVDYLDSISDDDQLAIVWFEKEEIGESLSDEEWASRCNDLLLSDTMKDIAENIINR